MMRDAGIPVGGKLGYVCKQEYVAKLFVNTLK